MISSLGFVPRLSMLPDEVELEQGTVHGAWQISRWKFTVAYHLSVQSASEEQSDFMSVNFDLDQAETCYGRLYIVHSSLERIT